MTYTSNKLFLALTVVLMTVGAMPALSETKSSIWEFFCPNKKDASFNDPGCYASIMFGLEFGTTDITTDMDNTQIKDSETEHLIGDGIIQSERLALGGWLASKNNPYTLGVEADSTLYNGSTHESLGGMGRWQMKKNRSYGITAKIGYKPPNCGGKCLVYFIGGHRWLSAIAEVEPAGLIPDQPMIAGSTRRNFDVSGNEFGIGAYFPFFNLLWADNNMWNIEYRHVRYDLDWSFQTAQNTYNPDIGVDEHIIWFNFSLPR